MRRKPLPAFVFFSLALAALPATLPPARAAPEEESPGMESLHVADLAWMAGTWRGRVGDDVVEEIWGEPLGSAMTGVFRWMKGGDVYMYEILAVEETPEGVFLGLRHFGPGLEPWEEAGRAIPARRLVEHASRRAVFEDPAVVFPRRIVYERPDEKTLLARLEGTKDGQPAAMEFRFTRP